MKKILLGLMIAFAFTQTTFASDRSFKMGVRLADGYQTEIGDDAGDDVGGNAFFASLPMEFAFNPLVSLMIDPGFEISVLEASDNSYDDIEELDLLYLNLPIVARFNFGGGFAIVGPQINLNLVATYDDGWDVEDFDYMSTTEIAITMGGGYRFFFGLELDARLNISLTDMYDFDQIDSDVQRLSFQFGISYWFLH